MITVRVPVDIPHEVFDRLCVQWEESQRGGFTGTFAEFVAMVCASWVGQYA